MAGSSNLLTMGLVAGGGYLAYKMFFSAPAAPVTPPTPATVVPDPNAIIGSHTLDSIYQRMVSTAKAPGEGLTADEWNFFLMAAEPSIAAPDPMAVFGAVPGFDRSQKITAAQYWAQMGPYLKSKMGLSGLGFYASAFRRER